MAKKILERTKALTVEEAQSKKKDDRSKKCRYCTNTKDIKKFYLTQDFLDTDGKMSICIDCCTYLFNYYYSLHGRIDIAIYEVCRCLNVRYDSRAYSSLMLALERNSMQATINSINGDAEDDCCESDIDKIAVDTKYSLFGKYYTILRTTYMNNEDIDLSFDVYKNDRPDGYEDKSTDKPVTEVLDDIYSKKLTLMEKKWGKQTEEDDYSFLESEYSSWAKTKDTEEKGVDLLIKEICLQQLKMRKTREDGQDIKKNDVDILTSLMDKCSLTPDRMKENTSNKSANAYGIWIKDVETLSPAEWIENKKLFKDVEGIDAYVNNTYSRAVKNYIGMQRDFRIISDKMEKEAEDLDLSDVGGLTEPAEESLEEKNGEECN